MQWIIMENWSWKAQCNSDMRDQVHGPVGGAVKEIWQKGDKNTQRLQKLPTRSPGQQNLLPVDGDEDVKTL